MSHTFPDPQAEVKPINEKPAALTPLQQWNKTLEDLAKSYADARVKRAEAEQECNVLARQLSDHLLAQPQESTK